MSYCCSQMDPSSVSKLRNIMAQRKRGLIPLKQFQEAVISNLKPWDRRRLKRELKADFGLNFELTDHFLARLIIRYGNENVDYLMETVRVSFKKAQSLRKTNIYAENSVIVCDPHRRRLVSIYPRSARRQGRYCR